MLVLALTGDEITGRQAAGAAVHLVGSFGVTVVDNVPRNDRLAHDETVWTAYLREWSAANHARGALALVAAVLPAA